MFLLDDIVSGDWHRQLRALKWCRGISIGALCIPWLNTMYHYGVRPDEPQWFWMGVHTVVIFVGMYFYYGFYKQMFDRHWQKPFERIAGDS